MNTKSPIKENHITNDAKTNRSTFFDNSGFGPSTEWALKDIVNIK